MSEPDGQLSYQAAGVDLAAARRHTAAITSLVEGGTVGFAAAQALPPGMREPLLVSATDGVGTKLLLARQLDRLEGLGQDLVAMSVNDLVCCGAQPLGFLDYLAVGALDPEEASGLVRGVAEACRQSGCALVGGETAELPGLYAPGHFDLAGFAYGVVERDLAWGPARVRAGDLVVGVASSGLHANGFSLVRALIEDEALAADPDLLLSPTRLYAPDVARLQAEGLEIHAAAHITGGGLGENLPRALPAGLRAALDPAAWSIGAAAEAVLATGRVAPTEAWTTFNMGLGLCLVCPEGSASRVAASIAGAGVVGFVEEGAAGVRFV